MRRSFITSLKEQDPNADLPRSASGGGFGIPVLKPFKVPTSTHITSTRASTSRSAPLPPPGSRKRQRIYTENDFYSSSSSAPQGSKDDSYDPLAAAREEKKSKKKKKGNEDDDDEDVKKKKAGFADRYVAPPPPRSFPVYKPKPFDSTLSRSFALPGIKRKGIILETKLTHAALGVRRAIEVPPRPLFDPLQDHAIVLWDPTVDDREAERELAALALAKEQGATEEDKERNKVHRSLAEILGLQTREDEKKKKKIKVPVVLDPRVGKVLRPHQVEGVKFLYKCVTGMTDENAYGCIMADEMGLGKTLQCITLLWTLLKQSPLAGKSSIDKAIVVCPSSLVRNWANELVKWLGEGAVNPLPIDGKLNGAELIPLVRQWCASKAKAVVTPVIIVSYEKLRTLTEELGKTEVGLLLADEGHRLKNSDNQTYSALNQINCKRRVILTGTPIQNDLDEYFSLLNFCNPGYLGTKQDFHRKFELPIIKGRDGDASDKQKEVGDATLKELGMTVNKFIIRRTNDLLSKYLPVKYEHVVFCSLSPFQLDLYKHFMNSPSAKALLRGKDSQPLKAITLLRKLCNHPDLLKFDEDLPGSEGTYPEGYDPLDKRRKLDPELSGKMAVLDRFLMKMAKETNDKIVLISNFTQTLDLFEKLCNARRYGWLRLDGTMNPTKRQKLVDKFNDPAGTELVFLLSSKAGGCGINLIGANRLILFDPDWNPASDMQALARVWRDGQKKNCFVYRFVATGTVEEKSQFFPFNFSLEALKRTVGRASPLSSLECPNNLRCRRKACNSALHDAHIEVPLSTKAWEPLRAYQKRLTTLTAKDPAIALSPVKTKAGANGKGKGKAKATSEQNESDLSDQEDEPSKPIPRPRPERTGRVSPSKKKKQKTAEAETDDDEDAISAEEVLPSRRKKRRAATPSEDEDSGKRRRRDEALDDTPSPRSLVEAPVKKKRPRAEEVPEGSDSGAQDGEPDDGRANEDSEQAPANADHAEAAQEDEAIRPPTSNASQASVTEIRRTKKRARR